MATRKKPQTRQAEEAVGRAAQEAAVQEEQAAADAAASEEQAAEQAAGPAADDEQKAIELDVDAEIEEGFRCLECGWSGTKYRTIAWCPLCKGAIVVEARPKRG